MTTAPRAARRARTVGLAAALALAVAGWPAGAAAKGGAFRESPHGRPDAGVRRVPSLPRGACGHCHGAPREISRRKGAGPRFKARGALSERGTCLSCHELPAGTWLGGRAYDESAHGASPAAVWPGPSPRARDSADSGKCVNCHDPHGAKDAAGLVPDLLVARGSALCLTCHTGNPASDVATALSKAYRHPLVPDPAAGSGDAGAPALVGAATARGGRAATCSGCHNPHAAARNGMARRDGAGSRALQGASHVRLSSAAAGAPRLSTAVAPDLTTQVREHEVCFKCHAGAAPGASRWTDLGQAFNPANASFHPVEATAKNAGIDPRSFASGWMPGRMVTCSDCHGSDDDTSRGPHGSDHPHILRRRYPTGQGIDQQPRETDLCFSCHAYAAYGNPPAGAQPGLSRFLGHRSHAARSVSCWACHDPHGSKDLPSLVALRSPGIVAYAREPAGGSCTVTCHTIAPATVDYDVAYRR